MQSLPSVLLSICTIYLGIGKGRMVPCCYKTKSLHWDQMLSCDYIWPELNAPLLLRHDKKASALWLVYFFGCVWALIAMFKLQNWNQSVFWQVHALSFQIRTKTFDLVNFSKYFYWTQGPPILEMISDLRHLYPYVFGQISFAWVDICAMKIVID